MSADSNRHVAVESRTPEVRRVLESDQPLLAQGSAGVTTDGRCRSGIVKSDSRSVDVDGDDQCFSGKAGLRRKADDRESEND